MANAFEYHRFVLTRKQSTETLTNNNNRSPMFCDFRVCVCARLLSTQNVKNQLTFASQKPGTKSPKLQQIAIFLTHITYEQHKHSINPAKCKYCRDLKMKMEVPVSVTYT